MTSIERIAAEIAGGLVLCAAFIGWWQMHNHTMQKIGAATCILSTTEVKTDVVKDNTGIEAAHAAQLTQVVAVYDKKLADSASANASLAARMHDYALRQSTVAGAGRAACPSDTERGLPAGESPPGAGLGRLADDTQAVLDACDADHGKVILVSAAYNDWRQKMIDANAHLQ
jgi:hypothetical protein